MRSEMRLRTLPDSPGARLFAGQGDFGQRAGGDRLDVDQPQVVEYGLLRQLVRRYSACCCGTPRPDIRSIRFAVDDAGDCRSPRAACPLPDGWLPSGVSRSYSGFSLRTFAVQASPTGAHQPAGCGKPSPGNWSPTAAAYLRRSLPAV